MYLVKKWSNEREQFSYMYIYLHAQLMTQKKSDYLISREDGVSLRLQKAGQGLQMRVRGVRVTSNGTKAYKIIHLQSNGILVLVECYVDLQELLNR